MFIELLLCSVLCAVFDFILPTLHGVGNHYFLYFIDKQEILQLTV